MTVYFQITNYLRGLPKNVVIYQNNQSCYALETFLQVGPPYRRFQSRRRILMKFAKLSTVQDEECPKVLFYV